MERLQMKKSGRPCPFIDAEDSRCAERFSLDHLHHAFKFCFGRFKACPTYLSLQVEARVEQMRAGPGATEKVIEEAPLVQVSIRNRHPNRGTAGEGIPVPFGG
jgi:hypothetical protein